MKSVSEDDEVLRVRKPRRVRRSRRVRPKLSKAELAVAQIAAEREELRKALADVGHEYRETLAMYHTADAWVRSMIDNNHALRDEVEERDRIARSALQERRDAMITLQEVKDRAAEEQRRTAQAYEDLKKHLEEELEVRTGEALERAEAAEAKLERIEGFRGFQAMQEAHTLIPKWERRYAALEAQNHHLSKLLDERDNLLKRLTGRIDRDLAGRVRGWIEEASNSMEEEAGDLQKRSDTLRLLLNYLPEEED